MIRSVKFYACGLNLHALSFFQIRVRLQIHVTLKPPLVMVCHISRKRKIFRGISVVYLRHSAYRHLWILFAINISVESNTS
jgi:hypothetical protein